MKVTVIPIILGALRAVSESWKKKARIIEDQMKNRYHPDHSIMKISLNTLRKPQDLMRLAVTQPPVKDYFLKLVGKTSKEFNNNNNNNGQKGIEKENFVGRLIKKREREREWRLIKKEERERKRESEWRLIKKEERERERERESEWRLIKKEERERGREREGERERGERERESEWRVKPPCTKNKNKKKTVFMKRIINFTNQIFHYLQDISSAKNDTKIKWRIKTKEKKSISRKKTRKKKELTAMFIQWLICHNHLLSLSLFYFLSGLFSILYFSVIRICWCLNLRTQTINLNITKRHLTLSIYLSIYLSISICTYLSIYLSIYLNIYIYIYVCVYIY